MAEQKWGIHSYREAPESGGYLVVELVLAGYCFPIRVWGTGRNG